MKTYKMTLCCLFIASATSNLLGESIEVRPGQGNNVSVFDTITSALERAKANNNVDEIVIHRNGQPGDIQPYRLWVEDDEPGTEDANLVVTANLTGLTIRGEEYDDGHVVTIDGNASAAGGTFYGIDLQANGVTLKNLRFSNCLWGGGLIGGDDAIIEDCIFDGNFRQGLRVTGADATLTRCMFKNTKIIDQCQGCNVRGLGCKLNDCHAFDNEGDGIWVADTNASNLAGATLTGCHVYRNKRQGILVIGATGGTVVDTCESYENDDAGIQVENDSDHVAIRNCEIYRNNIYRYQSPSGLGDGDGNTLDAEVFVDTVGVFREIELQLHPELGGVNLVSVTVVEDESDSQEMPRVYEAKNLPTGNPLLPRGLFRKPGGFILKTTADPTQNLFDKRPDSLVVTFLNSDGVQELEDVTDLQINDGLTCGVVEEVQPDGRIDPVYDTDSDGNFDNGGGGEAGVWIDCSTNILVDGCTIYENALGVRIDISEEGSDEKNRNVIVRYNKVVDNVGQNTYQMAAVKPQEGAILVENSERVAIYHNTFWNNGALQGRGISESFPNRGPSVGGFRLSTGCSEISFFNNIIGKVIDNSTNPVSGLLVIDGPPQESIFEMNSNVYDETEAPFADPYRYFSNYLSFEGYQQEMAMESANFETASDDGPAVLSDDWTPFGESAALESAQWIATVDAVDGTKITLDRPSWYFWPKDEIRLNGEDYTIEGFDNDGLSLTLNAVPDLTISADTDVPVMLEEVHGNQPDIGAVEHDVVPGDTDFDGDVDFGDFLVLSANFGAPGNWGWEHGDFDGNGAIEFVDFLILSSNFGGPETEAEMAAVLFED